MVHSAKDFLFNQTCFCWSTCYQHEGLLTLPCLTASACQNAEVIQGLEKSRFAYCTAYATHISGSTDHVGMLFSKDNLF